MLRLFCIVLTIASRCIAGPAQVQSSSINEIINAQESSIKNQMAAIFSLPFFFTPSFAPFLVPHPNAMINNGAKTNLDASTCQLSLNLSSIDPDSEVVVESIDQTVLIKTSRSTSTSNQSPNSIYHSAGSSRSTSSYLIPPSCLVDPKRTTAEFSKTKKILTITFPQASSPIEIDAASDPPTSAQSHEGHNNNGQLHQASSSFEDYPLPNLRSQQILVTELL